MQLSLCRYLARTSTQNSYQSATMLPGPLGRYQSSLVSQPCLCVCACMGGWMNMRDSPWCDHLPYAWSPVSTLLVWIWSSGDGSWGITETSHPHTPGGKDTVPDWHIKPVTAGWIGCTALRRLTISHYTDQGSNLVPLGWGKCANHCIMEIVCVCLNIYLGVCECLSRASLCVWTLDLCIYFHLLRLSSLVLMFPLQAQIWGCTSTWCSMTLSSSSTSPTHPKHCLRTQVNPPSLLTCPLT